MELNQVPLIHIVYAEFLGFPWDFPREFPWAAKGNTLRILVTRIPSGCIFLFVGYRRIPRDTMGSCGYSRRPHGLTSKAHGASWAPVGRPTGAHGVHHGPRRDTMMYGGFPWIFGGSTRGSPGINPVHHPYPPDMPVSMLTIPRVCAHPCTYQQQQKTVSIRHERNTRQCNLLPSTNVSRKATTVSLV